MAQQQGVARQSEPEGVSMWEASQQAGKRRRLEASQTEPDILWTSQIRNPRPIPDRTKDDEYLSLEPEEDVWIPDEGENILAGIDDRAAEILGSVADGGAMVSLIVVHDAGR